MKLSILAVKITVFVRKKKEFWIKTHFYRFFYKKHALNRRKISNNSRELLGGEGGVKRTQVIGESWLLLWSCTLHCRVHSPIGARVGNSVSATFPGILWMKRGLFSDSVAMSVWWQWHGAPTFVRTPSRSSEYLVYFFNHRCSVDVRVQHQFPLYQFRKWSNIGVLAC